MEQQDLDSRNSLLSAGMQALPVKRIEGSRITPGKILRCVQDDIAELRTKQTPMQQIMD
jgi:hypothetical protein